MWCFEYDIIKTRLYKFSIKEVCTDYYCIVFVSRIKSLIIDSYNKKLIVSMEKQHTSFEKVEKED
jgi:hypothetical protein